MTSTTGRLRVLDHAHVRPFAVRLDPPIAGESLHGFVARSLARSPVHQTVQGLALAGIGKLAATGLPTTLVDPQEIASLAKLLWTTPAEIEARLHRAGTLDNGRSAAIDFFGTMIRSDYRETATRRVSPRALRASAHHRAVWDIRIFSFDPQTRETLLDTCPKCHRKLGWRRAYGVQHCEHCLSKDRRPLVDLREHGQRLVEVDDDEALEFVTGLVDPDPALRAAAAAKADRAMWAGTSPSELFETVVAFACALSMLPEEARTTLDRPKKLEEYGRFTPELLAASGRALLDGRKGFSRICDRVRADADRRPGHYGVKKELLPLFCMTVDQHLTDRTKETLKAEITADMHRTRPGTVLRRADYGGDLQWLTIEGYVERTGLQRRVLSRLADSGQVETVTATDAKQAPKLMRIDEVMPLVALFNASIHEMHAAGKLDVPRHVLPTLVARGLVRKVEGPVTVMFETQDAYYLDEDVERLAGQIAQRVAAGGIPDNSMRISKAVKRLGMTPIPWGAVVAAIAKGTAPVCTIPGANKTWKTGGGTADLGAFLAAVQAEIHDADAVVPDEFIGNAVASEMLGITEVFFIQIANHGLLTRCGPSPLKQFKRREVEEFARTYILVPEIQRRAGLSRARDVRAWLAERGVKPEFELGDGRYIGFRRARAERVLGMDCG